MAFRDRMEKQLDRLRQTRDELRVRLHLGRAELRDEFEKAEHKWTKVRSELDRLGDDTKEPTDTIMKGIEGVVDEIRHTYDRIGQRLKERES